MYRFKNRYQVYVDDLLRIDFTSVKQSNKSYNSFRNSNKTSQTTLTLVKDSSAAPFINVASADSGVPTTASDAF